MKAFTVYQPYAYAIVSGLKHYETRSRRTNIRGRVAVHAGKRFYGKPNLPLGAVVGTVEIVGCVPTEQIADVLTLQELALGDYSPGRWAWVLKNPVMFDEPIPVCGKQGWWEWELPELIIKKYMVERGYEL